MLAGDYDNRSAQVIATGLGCGIQVRAWFREASDRAPASWLEGSIQVRTRLTSSPREGGLFVRASLWF